MQATTTGSVNICEIVRLIAQADPRLTDDDLHLLRYYWDRADFQTGECWAKPLTIMQALNRSLSWLKRHRRRLVNLGYMDHVGRRMWRRGRKLHSLWRITTPTEQPLSFPACDPHETRTVPPPHEDQENPCRNPQALSPLNSGVGTDRQPPLFTDPGNCQRAEQLDRPRASRASRDCRPATVFPSEPSPPTDPSKPQRAEAHQPHRPMRASRFAQSPPIMTSEPSEQTDPVGPQRAVHSNRPRYLHSDDPRKHGLARLQARAESAIHELRAERPEHADALESWARETIASCRFRRGGWQRAITSIRAMALKLRLQGESATIRQLSPALQRLQALRDQHTIRRDHLKGVTISMLLRSSGA